MPPAMYGRLVHAATSPACYNHRMSSRGLLFWLRRNVSRLALTLGVVCVIELFMHLTEGTNPNTRMPLEYWPWFVAGLGVVSFLVGWLLYIPPAPPDAVRDERTTTEADENSARN